MKHQTLLINQTIRKEKLKTKTKRNNLTIIDKNTYKKFKIYFPTSP